MTQLDTPKYILQLFKDLKRELPQTVDNVDIVAALLTVAAVYEYNSYNQ